MEPAPAVVRGRASAGLFGRRRLFWVIVGVAILTVAMIVAIAVMGAAESPAVGTSMDTSTSSTLAAVAAATEPVGTSTTVAPRTSSSSTSSPSSTSSSSTTTTEPLHAIADPVRLVIPSLGADAKIVAVGLKNGSEMVVPDVGIVGWYKLGPAPGAAGPSVLVSHVSWSGAKGVFYKLKEMKAGDQFQVYGSSGDYAVFQVDSLETILKSKLPTERIWNETEESVMRLVTCGGKYDSKTGHYLSNVIVYAHLVK